MKQSREQLKAYFERGDTPTSEQFGELIESGVNQLDDGLTVTPEQRVGINSNSPQSRLAVGGNLTVGKELCNTVAAPANGLLVQGPVSTEEALRLKVQRSTPSARASEGQLYVKEQDFYQLKIAGGSYVDLTGQQDKLSHLSTGTLSVWYHPDNPPSTGPQNILYLGNPGQPEPCYLFLGIGPWTEAYGDECLNFTVADNHSWYSGYVQRGHDYFTRHRWYHIVVVVDSQGLRIYLDGIEQSYDLQGNRPPANHFFNTLWESANIPDRFYLGVRNLGNGFDVHLQGYLDEFAILNTSLQAEEIAELFRAGRETDLRTLYSSELEAYWRLGDADQFPHLPSYGNQEITGKFKGDVDPLPIQKETQQTLMFQDGKGQETPITQQRGATQAGQLWGQKGDNLYFTEGFVGIGTPDPTMPLQVNGLVERQHVALSVYGTHHISSGSIQRVIYATTHLLENCEWDGGILTVTQPGIYSMALGFTRDAHSNGGTDNDIYMRFRIDGQPITGVAWAGEGDGRRATASYSILRRLKPGQQVDTIFDSDAGLKRFIQTYYLTIFRL
ncbi:MAG TPA: hypothetical protein DCR93_04100 [Cytophagales bacterium]|nr:hypothetical protein [Cytophagales bacterium]